jgi:hypothetical protein
MREERTPSGECVGFDASRREGVKVEVADSIASLRESAERWIIGLANEGTDREPLPT